MFGYLLYDEFLKTSYICLGFGLLNAFLPMDYLNMYLFGDYEEKDINESFSEIEST